MRLRLSAVRGLEGSQTVDGRTAMKTMRLSVVATAALMTLGVSGGAQAQQQPPQSPNMSFFVTSVGPGKGGDLGGLDGADANCQRLGTAAGAGARGWRADLRTNPAGGALHAPYRIGRGPRQNFKGAVVAT